MSKNLKRNIANNIKIAIIAYITCAIILTINIMAGAETNEIAIIFIGPTVGTIINIITDIICEKQA